MKIAVIGAGVSGLSVAQILVKAGLDVTVLEKESLAGGIARTKNVSGSAYHVTGGHCFNSKHPEVLDFVFKNILPIENWHKVERKSQISFKKNFVSYPIEFAMKEIAEFDLDLASNMVQDYFATDEEDRSNLANWFRSKFGTTLADEYFIPYNEKVWNRKASEMLPDWVEDKLPLPNKSAFTKALLKSNKDTMPHSTFFYPKSNNQNTFIEALARGLKIIYDFEVFSIEKVGSHWHINDSDIFDVVINTSPLNLFPRVLKGCPEDVLSAAKLLRYNKVSTMLWRTCGNQDTWTYYPDDDTLFHRHIHIGNFYTPSENLTITEAVGEHTFEEMKGEGERFDYLLEPIDFHVSDHAYVVFDNNYKYSREKILNYIENQSGVYTLGRFGEWEYYNMDICIKSAMNLSKRILTSCPSHAL